MRVGGVSFCFGVSGLTLFNDDLRKGLGKIMEKGCGEEETAEGKGC